MRWPKPLFAARQNRAKIRVPETENIQSMLKNISIRGAREHNLKNVDVEIPRDTLTVLTGLSGSGKSSLAFDTIYAEGQRRYVESLSAYARQFLWTISRVCRPPSPSNRRPPARIPARPLARSPRFMTI
jgi:hypothetical protein